MAGQRLSGWFGGRRLVPRGKRVAVTRVRSLIGAESAALTDGRQLTTRSKPPVESAVPVAATVEVNFRLLLIP
jgi:hypothetical protein